MGKVCIGDEGGCHGCHGGHRQRQNVRKQVTDGSQAIDNASLSCGVAPRFCVSSSTTAFVLISPSSTLPIMVATEPNISHPKESIRETAEGALHVKMHQARWCITQKNAPVDNAPLPSQQSPTLGAHAHAHHHPCPWVLVGMGSILLFMGEHGLKQSILKGVIDRALIQCFRG